jgi:hemolysin III
MLFASTEVAADGCVPLVHLPGFYEPFAAISHLLGAALFLVLGFLLLRRGWGERKRTALLAIYAAACVFQFSMSGIYHMTVRGGAAHELMGQLDHAAIYLLIAGTFTPCYGLLYRGRLRWALLLPTWIAAIVGILLTTVLANNVPEGLRLGLYQVLGWSGIMATLDVSRRYGFAFVWPVLAGGAMTSLAALTQYYGWPVLIPGVIHAHETFHVVMLVGTIFQWAFIWQLANGKIPSTMDERRLRRRINVVNAPHVPISLPAATKHATTASSASEEHPTRTFEPVLVGNRPELGKKISRPLAPLAASVAVDELT